MLQARKRSSDPGSGARLDEPFDVGSDPDRGSHPWGHIAHRATHQRFSGHDPASGNDAQLCAQDACCRSASHFSRAVDGGANDAVCHFVDPNNTEPWITPRSDY